MASDAKVVWHWLAAYEKIVGFVPPFGYSDCGSGQQLGHGGSERCQIRAAVGQVSEV